VTTLLPLLRYNAWHDMQRGCTNAADESSAARREDGETSRRISTQLREIKAVVEDLRRDVREVLAAKMARKSISRSESRHAD
jgi:hypothetical protein